MPCERENANCFMTEGQTPELPADGPLAGMRLAVKDLFNVKGFPTGAGNPDFLRLAAPAERNAAAVDLLLGAGAEFAGKTVTDEFAYSISGRNAHYGAPLNGAASERLPGGSSSGSASAVSCGLAEIGLGTDTGGSTRCPASSCGLFGIRPTHGRGPLSGCLPLAPSFDTCGLLARDIGTLRAASNALYGEDKGTGPERPRIIFPEDALEALGEQAVETLRCSALLLRSFFGGSESGRLALVPLAVTAEAFRRLQAAEAWGSFGEFITRERPSLGPGVKERFEFAREAAGMDLAEPRRVRSGLIRHLDGLLGDDGVMVLPTLSGPSPSRDAEEEEIGRFRTRNLLTLSAGSLSGLPWVSLPLGESDGAPVGLSMVGPRGRDEWLLSLAEAFVENCF
ncbi:MAG: amidase [Sutterellaceae bacterium]|nr:amidase [Sutterellaceae bacterium]MDY2868005.1 amidase [Mesosutterella sp.]